MMREPTAEQLSLEVLDQQDREWQMMMDREFPGWRQLRPDPPINLRVEEGWG